MHGAPRQARGRRHHAGPRPPGRRSTPAGAGPTSQEAGRRPGHREHPRRRGADESRRPYPRGHRGAPPQARGRQHGRRGRHPPRRSTPAGAGPTRSGRCRPRGRREHPRRRGADRARSRASASSRGAPPQARGRLVHPAVVGGVARSTPAGAGPTRCRATSGAALPEHPRRRGADVVAGLDLRDVEGAPPQARGRRRHLHRHQGRPRSTPAGAGPTNRPPNPQPTHPEHPRRRGADSSGTATWLQDAGAPPQARGRPGGSARWCGYGGSTPAGAGPTTSPPTCAPAPPEHPRRRGADGRTPHLPSCLPGAPPQARGRRYGAEDRLGEPGSTPAGAGPTLEHRPGRPKSTEHPRRRGADVGWRLRKGVPDGAPPQARGRPHRHRQPPDLGGSTPAGAGPTYSAPMSCWRGREHPRRRGADDPVGELNQVPQGAPPQARGRPAARPTPRSGAAEHPRRRGADVYGSGRPRPSKGAPPQARGRRAAASSAATSARSTPAGAGPTRTPPGRTAVPPEHPRRRGADTSGASVLVKLEGAPPQARGRPDVRSDVRASLEEHPRRRGADERGGGEVWMPAGAPPQARGRLCEPHAFQRHARSTPAGAGPTGPGASRARAVAEHPRRRGADLQLGQGPRVYGGAPPQARGRRTDRGQRCPCSRSTPAGAGPTRPWRPARSISREHPRRRGADARRPAADQRSEGAPPQARGRHHVRPGRRQPLRSTPAGAGPTRL